MARTSLTVQDVERSGLEPSYASANVDGNSFANNGRVILHAKNGSGGAITVTVKTPGTVDGLAVADRTVSVPAGEERMIGVFPPADYNQSDGDVYIDYSGVTSLTVAALRI